MSVCCIHAQIYSTEQTSSSYGGSTPSTPVSSPPPMAGGASSSHQQWSRGAGGATGQAGGPPGPGQPGYEGSHLQALPSMVEERLSDAIHLLRDHHVEVMAATPVFAFRGVEVKYCQVTSALAGPVLLFDHLIMVVTSKISHVAISQSRALPCDL
ncbi:transcription factor 4 [Plakobranchus ocellatus]|uniref:Transcription factor 4 n=1 Tax=Plakobranchus ocellatus TaxID=259542 RepID=A0AAV3YMB1_9GAST|nr:transcription factor 4 [Plakobranchus ocellatus]